MYTSTMLLALVGVVLPGEAIPSPSLAWVTDYGLARRQCQTTKRPLAVFMAPGTDGWDKVSKDGGFDREVRDILETSYVCLHIDTSTAEGKRLAEQFEIQGGTGVVLSDSKGEKQAFWHAGRLDNESLGKYLRKYSDPDRLVLSTEKVPEPGGSVTPAGYSRPVYRSNVVPAFSGRSC
jgi:hypothetical protein